MRTGYVDKARSGPLWMGADNFSLASLSDLTIREYVEVIGAGNRQDKRKPGTEANLKSRVPGCWCRSPDWMHQTRPWVITKP